jgi:hypothetical protein
VDWLKSLLSWGRLKGEPKAHTAGRALGPASVKRTQLGLREVNPPRGVVVLRSGEARCFLRVGGYPAHIRSQAEARAWLQGYARVLDTLPGNAVLLARSRPGGLERHIAQQRAQTAALARREPGGALARLSADQLAHARRLQATGEVRRMEGYLALHSPKGDVPRLLAAAGASRRHLEAAGVRVSLVKDRALLDALADSWRPAAGEGAALEFEWPPGALVGVLNFMPGERTTVSDPHATPAPRATVRQAHTNGKALPR